MYPPITVTPQKIREFGHIMLIGLGILLPLWIFWQRDWVWDSRLWGLIGLGLIIEGLCIWLGLRMAPVYRAWMLLAIWMGSVMTAVIVSVVFFLLITPIGLIRRLFKFSSDYQAYPDKRMLTYWKDRNEVIPSEQLEKMY